MAVSKVLMRHDVNDRYSPPTPGEKLVRFLLEPRPSETPLANAVARWLAVGGISVGAWYIVLELVPTIEVIWEFGWQTPRRFEEQLAFFAAIVSLAAIVGFVMGGIAILRRRKQATKILLISSWSWLAATFVLFVLSNYREVSVWRAGLGDRWQVRRLLNAIEHYALGAFYAISVLLVLRRSDVHACACPLELAFDPIIGDAPQHTIRKTPPQE